MNANTPSQGMMTGAQNDSPDPISHIGKEGFNGAIDVEGQQVHVVNGICTYDGNIYFVSNNGEVIVDTGRNVVGYVDNGVFRPTDESHMQQLKKMGVLEK